jgi:hypothetical protein
MTLLPSTPSTRAATLPKTATWHLIWFTGVSAGSFLVPFLLTSVWTLQHDLYYLIYFVTTLSMLAVYVRSSGFDLAERFRSRRRSSLLVGLIAAAFVVWSVLARVDGTPRPAGLYYLFEIFWRGAVYGIVDALLPAPSPVWLPSGSWGARPLGCCGAQPMGC